MMDNFFPGVDPMWAGTVEEDRVGWLQSTFKHSLFKVGQFWLEDGCKVTV